MRFAVTRAIQSGTTVNVFHNSFGYNRDFEGVMNGLWLCVGRCQIDVAVINVPPSYFRI